MNVQNLLIQSQILTVVFIFQKQKSADKGNHFFHVSLSQKSTTKQQVPRVKLE